MNLLDIKWEYEAPYRPQLVLYRGTTPIVAPAIRWQTDGHVAHAAILWPGMRLQEAAMKGVILRPWGEDKADADETTEIYDLPYLSGWEWSRAAAWAQGQVGKGYDFFGLARFLTRGCWGFHRFKKDRPNQTAPKRWFCSDLAFSIVEVAGVRLLERIEYFKISPEQLRRSPILKRVK
jgi:hypothetical protein